MKKTRNIVAFLLGVHLVLSCSSDDAQEETYLPIAVESPEEMSGGYNTTVFNQTVEAFGFASKKLTASEQTDFGVGNSFFRQSWISAPSSTTARDGLGPYYNAVSCGSCHFKDGRGRPPMNTNDLGHGLLLRLSLEGHDSNGNPFEDPVYGGQLQDNSINNVIRKGNYSITYTTVTRNHGRWSCGRTPTTNLPFHRSRLWPDGYRLAGIPKDRQPDGRSGAARGRHRSGHPEPRR
ncbi:di-heme oxidoredictase family protein [Flavobacterium sp.]|uniref:di-heme oxidoredictase family protein n=1 Tax=Flavobacterium sp. TaxID=239 RepID=UPI0039E5A36E